MGGIKNKLSKLTNNKAKNLLTNNKSLPIKGGLMSVAHRWGHITKYTGIACLSIAILSTLVLNILSSYSYSKVNSNAEPVGNANTNTTETSTLANASAISLSFAPISTPTSSPDTSNPANVSMQIPDGGGIATGGHTVTVSTGSDIASYELRLSSATEETALVNEDSTNNTKIVPIATEHLNVSGINGLEEALRNESNNTWAYSIDPYSFGHSIVPGYVAPLPPISAPDVINTNGSSLNNQYSIYYGTRVDHPESTPAGNYTNQVVYTITAKLHEPDIESIEPNTYELGSGTIGDDLANDGSLPITITGKYLSTVSRVYLTNTDPQHLIQEQNMTVLTHK